MTEFEKVLQECLQDLEAGAATVDECLNRHPQHAPQLEPILFAHASLRRAGKAYLAQAFQARVRARLIQDLRAHPRKSSRSGFVFARLAVSLAAIVLALLVTGTAYAQSALPGETLYAWKLASENAWRTVSSDPVETDLTIAERRVDELVLIKDDPTLRAQVLDEYLETATRLRSQTGTGDPARIARTLDSQMERLKKLGILLSQSDPATLPSDEPMPPTMTPLPTVQTTPQVEATDSAQVSPTLQFPPENIATVEIPPELVPTFEVPPPIR